MSEWTFTVSAKRMHKYSAWRRCAASGRRVGIPAHAWRKNHVYNSKGKPRKWSWYTASPEEIEKQERAMSRSRREVE